MRLEEFDPEYAINYLPGDIASMRNALNRYAELIESDDAFSGGYCCAHLYHSGDKIPFSYFEDHPDLVKYLFDDSYFFDEDSNMDDLQESMTGEALFFLCAVIHPELEEDLKHTCEVMVRYARELNDSSEMWLTCETPFGLEPIHIFATRYPKYGYLLASFMVPNWDQEHMGESVYQLASWKNKLGITDDTLKAFCYCDNKAARENMLGYDSWDGYDDSGDPIETNFDLIGHFRENPDEYEKFKQMLADRHREMPYLQYSDDLDEYNPTPLYQLVVEMLYVRQTIDLWDDELDLDTYLSQQFVNTDARQEMKDLTADIEKRLEHPVVVLKADVEGKKEQERQVREQQETPEAEPWKEVITRIFPNGEELWNYVITGENPALLDTVKKTDVAKLAKKAKCSLHKRLTLQATHSSGGMEGWIYIEMEQYAEECVELDPENGGEQVLRFYDIIHRCTGFAPLGSEVVNGFIEELEIITEEELDKRYPIPFLDEFKTFPKKLANQFEFYDHHRNFPKFYTMLNRNPDEAVPLVKEWLNPEESSSYAIVMAAYIAMRDHQESNVRELTDIAVQYLEKWGPEYLFANLSHDGAWPHYWEYHRLKDEVFDDDDDYQNDYQKRTLKHYPKWIPVEHYLSTGKFDERSGDEALNAAVDHFKQYTNYYDEDLADHQPRYKWFGFGHKRETLNVLMCYFALQIPGLKAAGIFQRFLQMGFKMGPLKVASCLCGMFPALEKTEDMEQFTKALALLKPLGLADDGYWAYQLYRLYNNIDIRAFDTEHPEKDTPERLHFFQLIKLALEGVDSVRAMETISPYLNEPLEDIYSALQDSVHLLRRDDLVEILYYLGDKIVRTREGITALLDQLALSKVRRSLEKEMRQVPQYFKARLEQQGFPCEKEFLSSEELHKEFGLPGDEINGYLTVDQYKEIKEDVDESSTNYTSYWAVVRKTADGIKILFNQKMLQYALWCEENNKNDGITGYFVCIIDETCPGEFIEELKALEKCDYRQKWMGQFEKYLRGEIDFDAMKSLIECGISDGNFLKEIGFHDAKLKMFIADLSPDLQKRILALAEAKNIKLM